MSKTIKPQELGAAIEQELTTYRKEVQDRINKAGSKAIKTVVRKTKDTAPFNARAYHPHYVDMITSKSETNQIGDAVHIWYVKPPGHRLTHLLVNGHATRDGGRTKADPFLQNALDQVLPEYEREVEEATRG